MRNVFGAACLLAIGAGVGFFGPSAVGSSSQGVALGAALPPGLPDPVLRTFEIDDRFVTVAITVTRSFPGAPLGIGSNGPWTTVDVTLSINDGALLPDGLRVVGVRFEKLRGANRYFFTPTSELTAVPFDGDFEEDVRAYRGDLSARSSVRFMNAVVRLERDGEIIKVNMGRIEVGQIFYP